MLKKILKALLSALKEVAPGLGKAVLDKVVSEARDKNEARDIKGALDEAGINFEEDDFTIPDDRKVAD
jgi:hypothetical protein